MSHEPGADELRMKAILKQRGVGPDVVLPTAPSQLPDGFERARPRDWLDDILDSTHEPAEPEPAAAAKRKPKAKARKKKRRKTRPAAARTAWDTRPPSPRQSLIDAWDNVPYRLKWLAYHASAAYLGWSMGLVDYATYVTAWIVDTGLIGVQAFFWYGAATCTFLLYRRARTWWWPIAWLAALPAASTVTGVLLYGTPTP